MQAPETPLAGHYRFSRSLQTGAKSVSWLAIDEQTRRTVIASALGAARVAGLEGIVGVRHPHLTAILDVIHDADPRSLPPQSGLKSTAVVVAEYVHGVTLHDRLRSSRLERAEAVELVEQLAQAVESLHAIGGVHGAISPRGIVASPENGPEGPVLSQLLAPPSGSYCSPERLLGHGPSTVDDMWALHATLYATLTGTTPFSGTSREQLVRSMLSEGAAPLSEHGIDDPELQELITRGLAPEPNDRRADVVEFREALHAWQDSHTGAVEQPAAGLSPIQPADDDEAEWDDDNAQTIVSSAAELLAAARAAGRAADDEAARALPPLDDADEDDEAPTSIVDVSSFRFPESRPPAPEVAPPRQSAPGPLPPRQSAPGPLPPPSAPHAAPPSAPAATAYDDEDDEDAATRILDAEAVLGRSADSAPEHPAPFPAPAPAPPMGFPGAPPQGPPFAPGLPPAEPPPVSPQEATVLSSAREQEQPRRRGVVLWALLTLIVACSVTAYLARDRLMPVLAGLGLVSAPGKATPTTPTGGSTPPPATAPSSTADGGSGAAAGDAATAGAADPGDGATTQGEKARPDDVGACVQSYFLPGTFHSTKGFDFLCKDADFRGINSQLYRRIVAAGGGKVTAGMKEWSEFNWYELPATAVVRHGCCPADVKPIRLPQLGGSCKELSKVLDDMVAAPPAPTAVSSSADGFADALGCLFKNGIPRPFHYGKLPTSANQAAFETFWRRAVTQYGK
jgi:serine/threonine-protein kinase